MKKGLFVIAVFFVFSSSAQAATAGCVNLYSNLSRGTTDAKSGGQVSLMQNYLVSAGYLSAKPNGVFGPATLAALKKFQAAHKISTTGTAGPITRMAIQIKSCAARVEQTLPPKPVTTTQTSTQTPTQTTPIQTYLPLPTQTVTPTTPIVTLYPQSGETLSLGDTYVVKWAGPASGVTYNIVLEDASSTAQGFIVAGSYANQYSWQVGNLNVSGAASTVTVPPGTYRVHAEDASVGPQSSDQRSGVFTITALINVTQIFPTKAPADANTTVVIYGAGFNSTSLVNIYGYGTVPPISVSPDGRAITFTVPHGVYPGSHMVSVINSYRNSTVTSESNQMSLLVTNP